MIILYTTHCPRCEVLKKKLMKKKILFIEEDNVKEIMQLGFKSSPILKVDDSYLEFSEAIDYVNKK